MGLDIHIDTNNWRELQAAEGPDHYRDRENGLFWKHSLSRTFCNFMCRQNIVSDPELDQIGRITGVDISPLYEMERYQEDDDEGMRMLLRYVDSEEGRNRVLADAAEERKKLAGNIDRVHATVDALISRLEAIPDLPALLIPTDDDTLGNQTYFADFQVEKGDGYIGNNFGQDLRNFCRFLEYAKSKGTTTVWFTYG